MNLGASRNKLAILGVLLAIAVYVLLSGGDDTPQKARRAQTPAAPAAGAEARVQPASRSLPEPNISRDVRRTGGGRQTIQEFKPTLKPKRPEDRVDPMTVDPTLRLDLLARLEKVKTEGGMRSLFDFSQAPPPEVKDVKIVPKPIKIGPEPEPVADSKPAAPPPKPVVPIPLKFYGFTSPSRQGVKRAFFLEGDEIYVAAEGETVKKRYQIVRIGVNSVVVKDMEQDSQQTLPLVEEQQG